MSEKIVDYLDGHQNNSLVRRPIDVHVGKRLRKRRKEVGLCCKSLAQKLALDEVSIISFEDGSTRIKADSLFNISQALDTRISYFFSD